MNLTAAQKSAIDTAFKAQITTRPISQWTQAHWTAFLKAQKIALGISENQPINWEPSRTKL